jgi:DNA-binding CsgD family transcriptional regulator
MDLLQNLMSVSDLTKLCELDLGGFQSLHFHLYLKDCKGKYISCNDRMAQDVGFSREGDLLGLTDFDFSFLPASEASILREHDSAVIKTDKANFFVEPCTLFDGSRMTAFSQKAPLRLKSKKIIGSIGFSLMVTNEQTVHTSISSCLVEIGSNEKLSQRQTDCLLYLVKGMAIKEIAKTLNLSPRTIEHYLDTIKIKLNCKNRAALIAKALRMKIIINRL